MTRAAIEPPHIVLRKFCAKVTSVSHRRQKGPFKERRALSVTQTHTSDQRNCPMSLTRRSLLVAAAAAPVIAFAATRSAAQTQRVYNNGGVAIDGTDAVAYFKEGRPVPGNPDLRVNWMGADWYFSSAENRTAFEADAKAYAPQYGGYCAWAVSQGYTASTVPEAWAIVDGKLYLNYSKRIQRRWEEDIPGHIAAADAQWPGIMTA